jgi:hypothetical protein
LSLAEREDNSMMTAKVDHDDLELAIRREIYRRTGGRVLGLEVEVHDEAAQLVMTDNNGKDWTFHLEKDGKIQLADKEVKLSDLKADDKVTIKYEKKDGKLVAQEIRCEKR